MVLYEERQKFNQKWVWAILIGSLILSFVSIYPLLGTDGYLVAILPFVITLLLAAAMAAFTLTTRVYHDRIEVGFTRFFTRTIRKENVTEVKVRTYDPIREYGGWGWRSGSSGTAYNVMGKQGLQLKLDSGKRLLIGTQRPAELAETIGTFWDQAEDSAKFNIPDRELDLIKSRERIKKDLL